MYNFDILVDRHNTDCIKWDRVGASFGNADAIPMWVADMDFEVLPELHEAIVKRAQHPTYGYTYASDAYYDNIIAWNKKRNHLTIEKEEIIPVPGVVTAVSFAVHALTQPRDKVLVSTPVYNPFFDVVNGSGRELVTSSLVWDGEKFVMDFADMEEKMKNGVKMIILCNPHNPVGRVWTKEELTALVELCDKHGVLIFSDEIHSDITFGGHHHTSLLTVSERAKEIGMIAMAPSKTFNIAGLKSSLFIIQNEELRQKIKSLMDAFHIGVDLFAYKATEVAYGCGEKWLDEVNEYLYENAKFTVEYLDEHLPKVKAYVPDGTYLMWLDFSAYGLSQNDLVEKMNNVAKVAMNNGVTYGKEAEGFMRLNIGCPKAMLQQALDQIISAFKD